VHRQSDLLQIVLALSTTGGFACLLNRRKQKCDQNRDNRDYDQKFDQRETTRSEGTKGQTLHKTPPRMTEIEAAAIGDFEHAK
jgi:hypothetical protein